MLKVAKFGGSSMADAKQFEKVRDIVRADPARKVIVVSAAGKRSADDHKLTDLLYLCYAHLQYGVNCDAVFQMICDRYIAIRDECGLNVDIEAELDAKATELGVKFDYTLYNGQADGTTLNQIGAELVSKGVDLIVPIATPAVKIMQSATEDTEIPIVFSAVSDPVGAGIVDSLDAPGGRITGTSDALNTKGLLDLMLAQNPDTKTVGLLYSKSEDSSKQPIEDAKAYLEGKGIRCVEKTGTTTDEVTSAVDALIAEKVDAVFTPTDNTIMTAELAIYEKFLNAKIPQYCGADSFALNGAFVGYGVDYTKLGTITADMVVQVLVDGKDPATLPVTTFDNGIAMINTESCAALGYDLAAVKQAFDGKCSSVLETTTQQNFD